MNEFHRDHLTRSAKILLEYSTEKEKELFFKIYESTDEKVFKEFELNKQDIIFSFIKAWYYRMKDND